MSFTAFGRCVSHVYGHKNIFNQYKNCSLDKIGERNMVSDLAISAQKYPNILPKKRDKFKRIRNTVVQNYVVNRPGVAGAVLYTASSLTD